jgi:phosphoribosylformylglycinamidine cyclo-ligase
MVNGNGFYGHANMSIGAKIAIAEEMRKHTGKTYYDLLAHSIVVELVNKMLASGVFPMSVAMSLAVDGESWFLDRKRSSDLIRGWKQACDLAGCVWADCSLTSQDGVFAPGMSLLSGSASGVAKRGQLLDPANIVPGDFIIMLEGSGVAHESLAVARRAMSHLSHGYASELPDGKLYGEALLEPGQIHVDFMEMVLGSDMKVHGCVNMNGSGWRKIMKAEQPLAYVIDRLPRMQSIFWFIQEYGLLTDEDAFASLDMGASLVLFVRPQDVAQLRELCKKHDRHDMFVAGRVEESPEKKLVIKPKNLEFRV